MNGPSGRKEEPLAEKASARPFLEIKRTYHFKLTKSGGSTQIIHSDAHERRVRSEGAKESLGCDFCRNGGERNGTPHSISASYLSFRTHKV